MSKKKRQRKAPTGTITGPCMDTTWQTPPELVAPVRKYFGGRIPFDAATALDNPCKARRFLTEADDGLEETFDDVGMLDAPHRPRLSLEPLFSSLVGDEETGQELDRNLSNKQTVAGNPHRAHTARGQPPLETVASNLHAFLN